MPATVWGTAKGRSTNAPTQPVHQPWLRASRYANGVTSAAARRAVNAAAWRLNSMAARISVARAAALSDCQDWPALISSSGKRMKANSRPLGIQSRTKNRVAILCWLGRVLTVLPAMA
jgi:hypothetical protein